MYGEEMKAEEDKLRAEEAKMGTKRKYNSQFNPQAARQNKLDTKKKYWLE